MGNQKYIEDQNKVLKQAALIVATVISAVVFTSVYSVFEPNLPFRGVDFLLPNSLITYFLILGIMIVLFFYCYRMIRDDKKMSIGYFLSLFLIMDFAPKFGPPFLMQLLFLALTLTFLFYWYLRRPKNSIWLAFFIPVFIYVMIPSNGDPFLNKYFGHSCKIAVDRNNTLYIIDGDSREILRINPDQYLYNRIHVPELEMFPKSYSFPLVDSESNFYVASGDHIFVFNLDTRKARQIEPEHIAYIHAMCLDANEDLIIFGTGSDNMTVLQWYDKDSTSVQEKTVDKDLGDIFRLCAADDGRLFLFDDNSGIVHVLDAQGVFINTWSVLDEEENSNKELLRHASMTVDNQGELFITVPGSGQLVKFDTQGEKTVKKINDRGTFGDYIASGPSKDIFILDWSYREIRQLDSDGNLRYTHGRFQWRHYRAFLRNLFT